MSEKLFPVLLCVLALLCSCAPRVSPEPPWPDVYIQPDSFDTCAGYVDGVDMPRVPWSPNGRPVRLYVVNVEPGTYFGYWSPFTSVSFPNENPDNVGTVPGASPGMGQPFLWGFLVEAGIWHGYWEGRGGVVAPWMPVWGRWPNYRAERLPVLVDSVLGTALRLRGNATRRNGKTVQSGLLVGENQPVSFPFLFGFLLEKRGAVGHTEPIGCALEAVGAPFLFGFLYDRDKPRYVLSMQLMTGSAVVGGPCVIELRRTEGRP
jgi:hypothetical protein